MVRPSGISVGLSLVALLGCSSEPDSSNAPLVNGAPSRDAAVVAVIHTRPDGTRQLCTGTLVAPTVVLTAKHCVFEDMGRADWVANPASSMSISLGDSIGAATGEIDVLTISTTSGPYRDGAGAVGGDIAMLGLASAPPGIAPALVSLDPPETGLALRIEGFGYTGAGATGTLGERNTGSASVVSVSAGTFVSEGASWTCTGDSGGPAFRASDGAVVGVTSIGPRGCPASSSIYTRLDVHADLLSAAGVTPAVGDAGLLEDAARGSEDAGADAGLVSSGSGCGCRVGTRPGGDWGLFCVLLAGLAPMARARRRRAMTSASGAPVSGGEG